MQHADSVFMLQALLQELGQVRRQAPRLWTARPGHSQRPPTRPGPLLCHPLPRPQGVVSARLVKVRLRGPGGEAVRSPFSIVFSNFVVKV